MELELWWMRPRIASLTNVPVPLVNRKSIAAWLENTDLYLMWSLNVFEVCILIPLNIFIQIPRHLWKILLSDSLYVCKYILLSTCSVGGGVSYCRGFSSPKPFGSQEQNQYQDTWVLLFFGFLSKSGIHSMFSIYEMEVILKALF